MRGPPSCQTSRQGPAGEGHPSLTGRPRARGGGQRETLERAPVLPPERGGAGKPAPSPVATGRAHCKIPAGGGGGGCVWVRERRGRLGYGAPLLHASCGRERCTWEAMLLRKEQAAMAAPPGGRSRPPLPRPPPFSFLPAPWAGGVVPFSGRGWESLFTLPSAQRRCAEADGCPTVQGRGGGEERRSERVVLERFTDKQGAGAVFPGCARAGSGGGGGSSGTAGAWGAREAT